MLVPICTKCGNRTIILGPRVTIRDDPRAYCADCRQFYRIFASDDTNIPLLEWSQL